MNWLIFMLILSDLSAKAEIIGVIGAVLVAVGCIFYIEHSVLPPADEAQAVYNARIFKKISIVGVILVTLAVLIPRPNTVYAIVGVKAADIGIEKLQSSEIFNKSIELLNLKLDKALKDD